MTTPVETDPAVFTAHDYLPGTVRHIVLFGLRPEVDAATRDELVARFRALVDGQRPDGRRPVVSVEAGEQIALEPPASGHDLGFVVTFASQGDRNYYAGRPMVDDERFIDPRHDEFKAFVGPLLLPGAEGCLVFDLADPTAD